MELEREPSDDAGLPGQITKCPLHHGKDILLSSCFDYGTVGVGVTVRVGWSVGAGVWVTVGAEVLAALPGVGVTVFVPPRATLITTLTI